MNCPKCSYPDGPRPGDHYKGLYTPDHKCDGCGFVDEEATRSESATDYRKGRVDSMKSFVVTAEQIARCPEKYLHCEHFRPDGTCKHFCERCKTNKVAYDGARFCGAACSAQAEAKQ